MRSVSHLFPFTPLLMIFPGMQIHFPLISRSTLLHLRIPFSLFLLPVFLIALTVSPGFDPCNAIVIFISLHVFLYPGASGFNAYYDRDTESIGMLRKPPVVTSDLLWVSLGFKTAAVLTAFFAGPVMAWGCLLYASASILYSWDKTRLKRWPFTGWLITGIGQGFITFIAITSSLSENGFALPSSDQLIAAICMTLMILAASPLLEIFQHQQDEKRGDITISRYAGVRGTIILSGVLFGASVTGFTYLFISIIGTMCAVLFLLLLIPAFLLFLRFSWKIVFNSLSPDYHQVMQIAIAASTGFNSFGLITLLWR